MQAFTSVAVLGALGLFVSAASAQQAESASGASIAVEYPSDRGRLQDHAAYLGVLQRRFEPLGLRVMVILPDPAAASHQATSPSYAVIGQAVPVSAIAFHFDVAGLPDPFAADDPDGLADQLAIALHVPVDHKRLDAIDKLTRYVRTYVEDGPATPEGTARLVGLNPHSGHAHACRCIDDLWNRGDLAAAHADAQTALATLAADGWPLVVFCDLVLRADANDRALAADIVAALQPVLKAEPEAPTARLCWLRAQLRVDAGKVTVQDAEALWPVCDGDAESLLALAEVVADAPEPKLFAPLAERAIDAAAALAPDRRWLLATRYKVALRCAGDAARAESCLVDYIGKQDRAYDINGEAWRLLIEFETMGRFDCLALAMMQRVQRQSSGKLADAYLDTMALALYGNGMFADAVANETKAITSGDGDPRYEARRLRFVRTQQALQSR